MVSNQYLFDNVTPLAGLGGVTELQYIDSHWIYTDHTQIVTGSAGVSYSVEWHALLGRHDLRQRIARR